MTSFFGEVRYAPSRAFEEEEDELEEIKYELSIELNETWKTGSTQAIVAAYGELATEFCETVLITENCKEVGSIKIVEVRITDVDDTGDFHPRIPKPSQIYLNPQGTLICCVSKDVSAKHSNSFTSKLLSLVPSGPVLVLSSHHYGSLQGSYAPKDGENCVVHSLSSPEFLKYKAAYPALPQPATVSSFPAAMLTTCMAMSRECILYPVYTETYSTGDLDLVASSLLKIFRSDPFSKLVTPELNHSCISQYRATNPRKETLDRYM